MNDSSFNDSLHANVSRFRKGMKQLGFNVLGNDEHPIAPVLLGDARWYIIIISLNFKRLWQAI